MRVLIHGDNLQAMNLLRNRYEGQIRCVFIDPPTTPATTNSFIATPISTHVGSACCSIAWRPAAFYSTEDGSLWCTLDSC